jgi:hypothetical protein
LSFFTTTVNRIIRAAVAITLLGFAIGLSVLPSVANAQAPVTSGAGLSVQGVWMGYFVNDGHDMYCVTPGLQLTAPQSTHTVSYWPAIGAAKSRNVEYVLGQWGNTSDNNQAAAVRLALLKIIGAHLPQAKALPASVKATADNYVALAKKYHGPYVTSVTFGTKVLDGQIGTAQVTVNSAAHQPVPGLTVALRASNATVPASVTTAANGLAEFQYVRTGTGMVKIVARASSVPPTSLLASQPAGGQQLLLGSGLPTIETASAAYQLTPGGPTVSYSCTSACNGQPPVSVQFCNPAEVVPTKYTVYDNKRAVAVAKFDPSSQPACQTVTVTIDDTHVVTFSVAYFVKNKWSHRVALPGSFTVDCPPWPAVSLSMTCNCVSGQLQMAISPNATHAEEIIYSVNGGPPQTSVGQPGQPVTVTVPLDRSASTTVTYTGAVQRSNGQWIIPPLFSVTVPAAGPATIM